MEPIKSIEEKLARLLPPALSEDAQHEMEALIDDLAGVDDVHASGFEWKAWSWKVAAAMALLAVPVVMISKNNRPFADASLAILDTDLAHSLSPEMVLLKSTRLIDGRENDGLIVPSDGSAPHYRYRYHVIDEEQVRDPESGSVITIRQPRQEVVTIPVTHF